jgi:hypothetical protein
MPATDQITPINDLIQTYKWFNDDSLKEKLNFVTHRLSEVYSFIKQKELEGNLLRLQEVLLTNELESREEKKPTENN